MTHAHSSKHSTRGSRLLGLLLQAAPILLANRELSAQHRCSTSELRSRKGMKIQEKELIQNLLISDNTMLGSISPPSVLRNREHLGIKISLSITHLGPGKGYRPQHDGKAAIYLPPHCPEHIYTSALSRRSCSTATQG